MPEHKMNDVERKAVDDFDRVMNKLLWGLLADDTEHGSVHRGGHRNRRDYLYWETPDQRMFCYSPWKDANGDYFTWVMKPVGRGAKSGDAEHWKRVGKVVRSRTRKTAKKRARARYKSWLAYLNQEWRNE